MNGTVRKALIAEAEQLVGALANFQPGSKNAVEELSRFLKLVGNVSELRDYLTYLPESFHVKRTDGAPAQFRETVKLVRPLLDRVKEADQMLYLLGWTRRLLTTDKRARSARSDSESEPTRSGGARR